MSASSQTLAAANKATTLRNTTELLGRFLLSSLFLMSGIGKITAYAGTAGYMESQGVPGFLLPLVILTEAGGAIAIIAGWRTRIVALLLAGFSILSAVLFHNNFADQIQMIMFLKNISIAGAFLMLAANGAGRYSLDARAGR
ncbi:DoxX family protein [Lysobacter terrae]